MQNQIKKQNSSGIVRLQGDKFFWDYDNKNILHVDINEIVIIGEYTNSDGPYLEDWFLTFVTSDGQWQSIPMYAENIEELTQYLSAKFQQDLNSTYLAGSTEWKSIIRHPLHLKEKKLFVLTPSTTYIEPTTFLDKLLSSVGFGNFDTTQNITLSEEVQNELTNASR